jgi:hypothetical protein
VFYEGSNIETNSRTLFSGSLHKFSPPEVALSSQGSGRPRTHAHEQGDGQLKHTSLASFEYELPSALRQLLLRRAGVLICPGNLESKITSMFIRTARCQSNRPEPFISAVDCSLSVLFLLLIVFLWLRLWALGLCDRDRRFLLHWLIWLDYRFLLRRNGLLRIAMLRVALFLI